MSIWLSHFKLEVTTTSRSLCEFTFIKLMPLRLTPVTDLKLRVFVLAVLASIPFERFQLCNLLKSSWKLAVLNKSFKSSAKSQGIASKKIAGRSLINSRRRSGTNTETCGTPLSTGRHMRADLGQKLLRSVEQVRSHQRNEIQIHTKCVKFLQ